MTPRCSSTKGPREGATPRERRWLLALCRPSPNKSSSASTLSSPSSAFASRQPFFGICYAYHHPKFWSCLYYCIFCPPLSILHHLRRYRTAPCELRCSSPCPWWPPWLCLLISGLTQRLLRTWIMRTRFPLHHLRTDKILKRWLTASLSSCLLGTRLNMRVCPWSSRLTHGANPGSVKTNRVFDNTIETADHQEFSSTEADESAILVTGGSETVLSWTRVEKSGGSSDFKATFWDGANAAIRVVSTMV